MMSAKLLRVFTCVTALASMAAGTGCVANRPSRNNVPNENQYLRKDFLINNGTSTAAPDPGWFMKATVVQTSTPNPFANAHLFQGSESSALNPGGTLVHFVVTQDKLQLVNNLELAPAATSNAGANQTTGEVVNAWEVSNVDLQYQVNLDGEKSNLFYENQELDWQVRQWVKLNFAKNDFSDFAPFGTNVQTFLNQCADNGGNPSATLVTNSFQVDTANKYWEFTLSLTVPVNPFDINGATDNEKACAKLFGATGNTFTLMGRNDVTFNVKYSFARPETMQNPTSAPYFPLAFQEKDAILHKYGVFQIDPIFRDYQSGLLGANQLGERWDPNQTITYYFAPGTPQFYKDFFASGKTGTTVQAQTNSVLAKAGAKGSVRFLNVDDQDTLGDKKNASMPKSYGDVRYSFINWHTNLDIGPDGVLGVAQNFVDPRSGQILAASVNTWAYSIQDEVVQRLTFYLQTLGEDPTVAPSTASCTGGQTLPLVPATITLKHDASSTVFQKLQGYLGKPSATFGNLSPSDFVPNQAKVPSFRTAFDTIAVFNIYEDPQANPFVTPDSGQTAYGAAAQWAALIKAAKFTALAGQLNHGVAPFDMSNPSNQYANALAFSATWSDLSQAMIQQEYMATFSHGSAQYDTSGQVDYINVFQKAGLQCVNSNDATTGNQPVAFGATGVWQNYQNYTSGLVNSIYEEVLLHEFGHTLGLRHNFMGSVDKKNFLYEDGDKATTPGLYSSSVMDYSVAASQAYFSGQTKTPDGSTVINAGGPGWGPYDIAALGFIYGNALTATDHPDYTKSNKVSYSGQSIDSSGKVLGPWKDPFGTMTTNGVTTENMFLYCSDEHTKHTPFCQPFDLGTTPSEIVANAIDNYEWQYYWTNYRQYRKIWTEQDYSARVTKFMNSLLRWQSAWIIDWNLQSLLQNYQHLNIPLPPGGNLNDFYVQLSNAFSSDISVANQLAVGFMNAVVQQGGGARPYTTTYDPFFGDVTQQGIAIDKIAAIDAITTVHTSSDTEDETQGQSSYFTPVSLPGGSQDPQYQQIAELALQQNTGGGVAIFPYAEYLSTANWAKTSHSQEFVLSAPRPELRSWIGGQVFNRFEDFLAYTSKLADEHNVWGCTSITDCQYNPTQPQPGEFPCPLVDGGTVAAYYAQDAGPDAAPLPLPPLSSNCPNYSNFSSSLNEFVGPDGRYYMWAYIPDRNQWFLVDRDRNAIAYNAMKNYNSDLVQSMDDGTTGGIGYGTLYQMEFTLRAILDYFEAANGTTPGSSNGN